jgi:hypothetical protein
MKKDLALGAIYNTIFLFVFVIVYSFGLNQLVTSYEWASFIGEFWFFILIALMLPVFFLIKGKSNLFIGGILGIFFYFVIGTLIMVITGVH